MSTEIETINASNTVEPPPVVAVTTLIEVPQPAQSRLAIAQTYLRTVIACACYFALLTSGLFVDSSKIDRSTIYGWLLLPCAATVTNIGLLCLAMSFVADVKGSPIMAIRRAMFIYSIWLGGFMAVVPKSILNADQIQYATMAGIATAVCFVFGYAPARFVGLVNQISGVLPFAKLESKP